MALATCGIVIQLVQTRRLADVNAGAAPAARRAQATAAAVIRIQHA